MKTNLKHVFLSLSLLCGCVFSSHSQLLYKIEGKDLEKPSYLFGTHHLAPVSFAEERDVLSYIDQTDQVVGEIDLTQDLMAISLATQSHMIAPADSTLSKVISPEDYSIISEEFKKWAPQNGLSLSFFDSMKPMVVSTMVTVSMMSELMPEFNPNEVLDLYFQKYGAEHGKKIIPFETADFQAGVLYDTTPISIQAEALVTMLKEPEKTIENARKLNDAYMAEDLQAMLNLSQEEDANSEFMNALLDKRNAEWLKKIPGILNDGTTFIAVGALHLPGENGLIKGLRKLGYTISPVE